MRDLSELTHLRARHLEHSFYGGMNHPMMERVHGIFQVPIKSSKRPLRVIASAGDAPGGHGWDHVSVSLPGRCPTWAEMDEVKRLFFHPHEVAMQLHPEESEHISNHPYCLHIWRPVNAKIPMPPSILVGVGSLGELTKQSSADFVNRLRSVGVL
ncbi:hypothetical protein [Novosphingobium sp. BL-52-GroH]|uniref:DUF7694 domain-containing protein n=1 Tax=Novosphingobium sp. BL-52-GroH TaxID=3349877 RepID=UPI00384B8A9F